MIPLLFAAAGGLFPALAGTLNIALEGLLLAGAFTSLVVFHFTGSVFLAVPAAAVSAVLLSLIHAFAAFKLRANLFITGLAVNLLAGGLSIVLLEKLFNTRGVVTAASVLYPAAFHQQRGFHFFFLALFFIFISWLILFKTPFGYRLRACEKNESALISLGIKPLYYQTLAFVICGFLCGIGGSFMSLNLGVFVPGMSAGKGWIGLVIIFLGARKPFGLILAAFLFALAEAFSNHAQGFWNLPADFILALPYICTLIAIIVVSFLSKVDINKKHMLIK
jgi:simple sugar transport system permease protein